MSTILCTRVLRPTNFKFFDTIKGYHPSKISWSIKGDWTPGPYPITEEEKRKAARRYGLIPQDYEPFDDDGTGFGDYPKLPVIAGEARDPYYSWNTAYNRDYNEPVPIDWMLTSDRIDFNFVPFGGWPMNILISYGFVLGIGLLGWLIDDYKAMWPTMPEDLPYTHREAFEYVKDTGQYLTEIKRKIHFSFPRTPQDEVFHCH